jgi:hypothetical protein
MANQDTNDTAFILIEPGLARKRNGNRIYARVRVAGKCTWKSTKTDDPELARKWKKKWEEKQWLQKQGYIAKEPESAETPTAAKNDNGGASETKLEPSSLTINKILDHYVAAGQPTVKKRKIKPKAPRSVENETYSLPPLRVYFGAKIAEQLTLGDCDAFHVWRRHGGYIAKFTCRGKPVQKKTKGGDRAVDLNLIVLSNALELAVRQGVLKSNPIRDRGRYADDSTAQTTIEAVSLRTATLSPDYIRTGSNGVLSNREGPGMRMHFAVRFGDEKSEEEKSLVRSGQVRTAFNSPFWPFVLATTSVGQEGLDFHSYCHAVVHWNLPSNPVDLEQREGRVHRYKGHAIRKNVACRHAQSGITSFNQDPWEQMFCDALAKRLPGSTHLTPFWIYPGHAKIQRHVPAFPLSRDQNRMEVLRKSLAVYRMVFGQIRQDDLIAFLLTRFPENEIASIAKELRIDLTPPKPAHIC